MNIRKLDTLLRNKLQWMESEVRADELNSILGKMQVADKKRKGYLAFIIPFIVLGSGLTGYFISQEVNKGVALETVGNQGQSEAVKDKDIYKKDVTTVIEIEGKQAKPGIRRVVEKGEKCRQNIGSGEKDLFNVIKWPDKNNLLAGDAPDETEMPGRFQIMGLSKKERAYETGIDLVPEMGKQGHAGKRTSMFGRLLRLARPELSFWVSPMMTFEKPSVNTSNEGGIHKDYLEKAGKSERPAFTVNSGIRLQFRLLPGLYLGTGIGYIQCGYAYDYDYRVNDIPIVDSATGRIKSYIHKPDSMSRHIDTRGSYIGKYLELPLSTRINLLKYKRYLFGLEPAYSLQILLRSSGAYVDPVTLQQADGKSYRIRTGNIQLGLSVKYFLNHRLSVYFIPYFGKALQAVSIIENRHRNYAGIKLSINYKLYNQK